MRWSVLLPRFSIASTFLATVVAVFLVALNLRESRSITEPYYAPLFGAVWHPPPYVMKEMAIDVHYDRGWPIWHTRRSEHLAAHNAPLYLTDDRPRVSAPNGTKGDFDMIFDDDTEMTYSAPPTTNWVRAGFDAIVSLVIIAITVALFELVSRRLRAARERPGIIDVSPNAT